MKLLKKYFGIVLNMSYGCIIGVANIIPGVSGGTMAVMLNIYDKLIDAFTGLRRHFKQSIKFLLPVLLGAGIGIVLFSKLIEYMIVNHPLPTCFFFIGLILGSLPLVFRRGLETKLRLPSFIPLILMLGLMTALAFVKTSGAETANTGFELNFGSWMFLFGGSAVAAVCMIIPGVSGSMILMVFGLYSTVIGAISDLTKHFMNSCMILLPVGLGVIAGIVCGAKLIDICIKRFPQMTYFAIIGLMLGSPLVIFMKFQSQSQAQEINNFTFTAVNITVSVVVCLVGIAIALFFGSDKLREKIAKNEDETVTVVKKEK